MNWLFKLSFSSEKKMHDCLFGNFISKWKICAVSEEGEKQAREKL